MARPIPLFPFLTILLLLSASAPLAAEEKTPEKKNLLIVGASSLRPPLAEYLAAMLESHKTPTNVEYGSSRIIEDRTLSRRKAWDYVVLDAWQFKRGATDAPEFPDAVAASVKQVRAHSPHCKIILFPWWLPSPRATNEDVMKVFQSCVDTAKQNDIWVATTGPAFMEARLARPDLNVTVSKDDAHPGIHGAYINACSLFAIVTGESPVGLPANLKIPGRDKDWAIASDDAKYLQELAWKVYQREIKNTKPVAPADSAKSAK